MDTRTLELGHETRASVHCRSLAARLPPGLDQAARRRRVRCRRPPLALRGADQSRLLVAGGRINVFEKDFADILQAFPEPDEYPQKQMGMPSTSTASNGRSAYRSSDRSMAARGNRGFGLPA